MAPERPPECPSMSAFLKDVASVYDETIKDKKKLKTESLIFFSICSFFPVFLTIYPMAFIK